MPATFPTSPINGELANVNSITYVYAAAQQSWTRVPGSAGGGGSAITNGTTNVTTATNGNANVTIAGTSNVVVWASTGEYVTGIISATANITGGNLITAGQVVATGNVTGGNLVTAGQAAVTGNITGGNIISSGIITTAGNIVTTGANGVANIGAVGAYFNTVHAKATSAQYADVAEWYSSDQHYEPGTVVVFGGSAEVTAAVHVGDDKIAGVVSTNPAYIMNAGIQSEYAVPVALTGRVPTKVVGSVNKGNMMISAGNGFAKACATPAIGTVIGKSLETFNGDIGIIEIVVGRI